MNQQHFSKKAFLPIILIPVLISFDQITKQWAVNRLKGQDDIILIRGVLQFRYVENRGAAFGILQNSRLFFILLTIVVLFVMTLFYIHYVRSNSVTLTVPILFSLLAAGAVGNFIDRLLHEFVTDFIYFCLIDFPVFNIADIYITCSCILIVIYVIISDKGHDHNVSQ